MSTNTERRRWGVAVIGCGSIGRVHVSALAATGRARIVGVSSRRAEHAQEIAATHGALVTTDPLELIRHPEVDLVSVTTPSGTHARWALAALEAGKHVVVEKPLAMRALEARRIVDAAAARGLTLGVVSQRRFEPQHRVLKRLLDDGALGRALLFEAACPYYRTQAYYDSADWRGTIANDGGALMNQAIHSVDLLLWLAGPAASVMGRIATQTHRMEAEDLALGIVTFTSGALGTIMASTSIQPGFQPSLSIYGEKGTVKLEGADITHWTVPGIDRPPSATREASAGVTSPQLASDEHHRAQLEDILDSIEQERAPLVTGEDGLRAVELVEGVYRASETGGAVVLGKI